MQLEWLEEFLRVASLGSITLAAKELHLSQPSLSKHMKNLEAEIGGALLERTNMCTMLTPLGRALQIEILEPVHLLRKRLDEIKSDAAWTCSAVRLDTFIPYKTYDDLIAKVQYRMAKEHSPIDLKIENVGSGDPLESVRTGKADLLLIQSLSVGRTEDGLVFEPIIAESLSVVVQKESALAERDSLSVADLDGEDILFCIGGATAEHNNAIMAFLDSRGITYQKEFMPWDPNFRNEINYEGVRGCLIDTSSFFEHDIAPYLLQGRCIVPLGPGEPGLITALVSRENEDDPAVLECIDRLRRESPLQRG